MKKYLALIAMAMVAGVAQAATDAGSPTLSEGTREIVVEGLFDPDTINDQQVDLSLGYGVFIQDNVEVGAEVFGSDNDAVGTWGVGAFGEYNFDQGSELVPFVGAGVSWQNVDVDDGESADAVVGEVKGGVKYFLASNVAISADVSWAIASDDIYVEQDDVSDTDLTVNLGMRFYIP
jgi:hypothetical protein